MASALIGALRVHLGLDSAEFSEGLNKSNKRAKSFGDQLKKTLSVVGASVGALTAAVTVGIKRTLDEADNMAKAAQRFGIPAEEMAKLAYAADLSGVSFESLGTGARQLAKNMAAVAGGTQNEAAKAFEALRISVTNTDGTLKSSSQVMTELAGKFGGMKDGAGKTALAMAIFGEAGANLIPMLNSGADGLSNLMAEAEKLGLVFDGPTRAAAEAFNDNLTRLKRTQDGMFIQLTARLAPALAALSDQLVGVAQNGETMKAVGDKIAEGIKWVAKESLLAWVGLQRLKLELQGFADAWRIFQESQKKSAEMADQGAGMFERLKFEWAALKDAFAAIGKGQAASADLLKKSLEDFEAAWAASMDRIKKMAEDGTGGTVDPPVMGTTTGWTEKIRTMLASTGKAHDEMASAARRVWEATRTPAEKYNEELERLNGLLEYGAINHDTYARAVAQAQDQMQSALDKTNEAAQANQTAYESWMRSVSDGFTDAIFKAQSFGDVLKQLLVQLAKAELSNWIFGGLTGKSGGGSIIGGLAKAVGFAGGFEKGGFIPPGQWGITGESGMEVVHGGRTGAQVIPMRDIGRGGTVINIDVDARQATDPAAVRLQVMQGIQMAMPQILQQGTAHTMKHITRPRIS